MRIREDYVLPVSVVLAVILLLGDYITGPVIQFPITYLIPVGVVSWYSGIAYGTSFALAMALTRFLFNLIWEVPWTKIEDAINTAILMTVLSAFAYLMHRTAYQTRKLKEQVRNLEGLLPICSSCKKIRNDKGEWEKVEKYISDHSKAEFTHASVRNVRISFIRKFMKTDNFGNHGASI